MNVKDYITKYNQYLTTIPNDEAYEIDGSNTEMVKIAATISVAMDMIGEIHGICEQRKSFTAASVYAVIKELDSKWRAFVRKLPVTVVPQPDEYFLELLMSENKAARDIINHYTQQVSRRY